MGRRLTHWASTASVVWAFLGSLDTKFGYFLKDPWIVLRFRLDVSNPNMTVYVFITTHLNFIQNERVKLDETYLDTQGHFKATFSNVMDV